MEFSVNTMALPGLAHLMDRRWRDLDGGRSYLATRTRIDAGDLGVLNWLRGTHERIVTAATAFLDRAAQDYTGRFATAVIEANLYYQRTDGSVAAALDRCLPGRDDTARPDLRSSRADPGLGPEIFADRTVPARHYQAPPDYHDYGVALGPVSALSPASDARELIWQVSRLAVYLGLLDHPYDVIDEAVRPLSGDWAAFRACADVYSAVGAALADGAGCVQDGVGSVGDVWTGNAADACSASLARFAAELKSASVALDAVSGSYRQCAEQIKALAEVLGALLTALIDLVVESALDAASDGLFAAVREVTTLRDIAATVLKMRHTIHLAWEVAHTYQRNSEVGPRCFAVLCDGHRLPPVTTAIPSLPRLPVATASLE